MGRYIVVAPFDPGALLGSFSAKGSWQEEANRRGSHRAQQQLADDLHRHRHIEVCSPDDALDVVGAVAVEMEPEEAAELRSRHPTASVLEDRQLLLIGPLLSDETVGEPPADRWHLDALGLKRARQEGRVGRGAGVRIALFDSGVDADHQELAHRPIEQAVLRDGEVELVAPNDTDADGHGTHTAGLAGGADVGVAPDADLLSLQAVEDRAIQLSDLLVTWIRYLVRREDVDVASLSIGLPASFFVDEPAALAAMEAAFGLLRRNDILAVVAIGNDGRNRVRYPGGLPQVLAVGACTRARKIWSSSSSGSVNTGGVIVPLPDLVAPGAGVYSSVPGDRYRPAWGTSQATPLVAGLAALFKERDESLGAGDLQEELLGSCSPLAGVAVDRQGAGMISL